MADSDTIRLEAFSDGVFAIAITLLVLEIKVPHLDGRGTTAAALASALYDDWPNYLAFAVSFFTILIMWTHHHAVFRLAQRTTSQLQFANGVLLLLTTTVAFTTAVVAEYINTPAAPAAAMLYIGQQVLLASAFYWLLWAATRPAVVAPDAPAATLRTLRRSYSLGPPMYAVTLIVAYFAPIVAMVISLALWIFWALVPARR